MSGRVIKFRAWDRKLKVMFPVHQLSYSILTNNLESLKGIDIHHKDSDHSGDVSYGGSIKKMTGNPLAPRFELMQSSSLRDNKRTEEYPEGQEIYEGDIFPNHFSSKIIGVVRFGEYANMGDDNHGGHIGFFIDWGDDGMLRKDLAYWAKVSRGVIGNTFENPELRMMKND